MILVEINEIHLKGLTIEVTILDMKVVIFTNDGQRNDEIDFVKCYIHS